MAPLAVTVSNADGSSQYYEIADDLLLSDVLPMVIADLGNSDHEMKFVRLLKDGRDLIDNESRLNSTLKDLGIATNDLLLYVYGKPKARPAPTPSASSSFPAPIALNPEAQAQLQNLIKSIKIPTNLAAGLQKSVEDPHTRKARQMFDAMGNPRVQAMAKERFPSVWEAYEKDKKDFAGFSAAYKAFVEEELRKQRVMQDPTSEEGQRLLQEMIQQNNIDYSYEQAYEHNPEAYIPISMLYINMVINGQPVKAFVDSGAQVSVMSLACARRCNLEHLIDKRFKGAVRGVGGQQNFAGKIHLCQVQIEDHRFPCYFDVLADREMDLLLGLNILRRHQCSIDLKINKLVFGDGTSTPFLSEKEVNEHQEAMDAVHAATADPDHQFVADAEKVTEIISLGFEESVAREELKKTGNNLETAVQNLFSRGAESSDSKMEH